MSATLDPNFLPRHAVHAWVDERSVYIAIPMKGKAPFIDRYPLTAAGLGEALAKMRNYHTAAPAPPVYTLPARQLPVERRSGPMSTDARLALAQSILKRMMVTPR